MVIKYDEFGNAYDPSVYQSKIGSHTGRLEETFKEPTKAQRDAAHFGKADSSVAASSQIARTSKPKAPKKKHNRFG